MNMKIAFSVFPLPRAAARSDEPHGAPRRSGVSRRVAAVAVFLALSGFGVAQAHAQSVGAPRQRIAHGALLEHPTKVLHGAGQTYEAGTPQDGGFDRYVEVVGTSRFPLLFMDYCSIGAGAAFFEKLAKRLDGYRDRYEREPIAQLGVSFPSGHAPVNEAQVAAFVASLKNYGRPAFIRPGYEFNGIWYQPLYEPASFKAWFRAIATGIRDAGLPVAVVWCAYPGYHPKFGSWNYIKDFYPGDDVVDWWGMDLFSPTDLAPRRGQANTATEEFLKMARKANKPVMIGEATPRGVGAQSAKAWQDWFAPFFEMIHAHPHIKAYHYINWDWAGTRWPDWGDARLETAPAAVRERYLAQIGSGLFLHAFPQGLPAEMRTSR